MSYQKTTTQSGYVILFSILITAIILTIIIGIANVSFRQHQFTTQVTQSTKAFYAAETALECIQAIDNKGLFVYDITQPPADVVLFCDVNTTPIIVNAPAGSPPYVYEFGYGNNGSLIEVSPNPTDFPMCARARVTKYEVAPTQPNPPNGLTRYLHTIQSFGYNVSCADLATHLDAITANQPSPIANRLVERSLSYSYQSEEQ